MAKLQTLIVISSLPLAINLPSGLKATLLTILVCPSSIFKPKSSPVKLDFINKQDYIVDRSSLTFERSHSEKVQSRNTLRFKIAFEKLILLNCLLMKYNLLEFKIVIMFVSNAYYYFFYK